MKLKLNGFLVLLLALITQISFAQERAVSGVVSDNAGMPLPGVSVLVKGSKTGTQTGFDGAYTIKATPSDVLVFSYIGMKTQERTASSTSIFVKLMDNTQLLNEVVVTSLGQKKQKKSLGYSTVTVSGKDLTEVTNTNVFGAMSGKMAGVDISAPAQVGASTKVVIRGFSSLGDNSPLYIVDGSPITNDENGQNGVRQRRTYDAGTGISDLDPNNIETITVLKGASATALYGSRAASGAIIITTKSGKVNQKLRVEISTSSDFSEVARIAHLQDKFGQGWLGQGYSGLPSHGVNVSAENGSWGPAFNGQIRPWGTIVNNSQQIKPYVALKNNVRDFYDIGTAFTNNIRVSGGGEKTTFSLGFSDVNSDGIIPTDADTYRRRNLNFGAGFNSDKLDVKVNLNYTKNNQKVVPTGVADESGEGAILLSELLQIPSDISVVDLKDYKNNPFNTPDYYFTPYASNPYFLLNENSTVIDGNRFFGNANFTYKFTPKLSVTYQLGGDYKNDRIKSYGAKEIFADGSSQFVNGKIQVVGGVTERSVARTQLDQYLNFNYNTKLNDDFNLNAMIGVASNERASDIFQTIITKLDLPGFYELSNSADRPVAAQGNSLRRNFGIYTSLEASYKDRIYLTLTGRKDWTSTLPVQNNSYFYPSASLSGIVINTPDTFLKLRGSWARVSKDTDPYNTESSFTAAIARANFGDIRFPIAGVNAYEYIGTLGNKNLKPETTTEVEFGFETNLFKNRVNLDASFYNKKTIDLLYAADIAASTGFTTQTANILDVSNKGIEIVLGLVPIKTDSFTWNINATFTKNMSNVDKVRNSSGIIELSNSRDVTFNAEVGKPLGVFKAKVPKQNTNGQYLVNAATGYYDPSDVQQEIGDSQRDFVIGLQNKFTYKNTALSFGFDWKKGGQMFSESKYLAYFTGNGIETTYNDRNGFIIPNSVNEVKKPDGTITYVENTTPVYSEVGGGNGVITDFYNSAKNATIAREFIVDKTFIRLRDISLTYNIPSKAIRNTGLSAVSISVYGKNLMLWTPNGNAYVDPEISTFGTGIQSEFGESYATPSQRSIGTNLKITF
jgi:TonB-linked SusC/RagA family outer membrane protein